MTTNGARTGQARTLCESICGNSWSLRHGAHRGPAKRAVRSAAPLGAGCYPERGSLGYGVQFAKLRAS